MHAAAFDPNRPVEANSRDMTFTGVQIGQALEPCLFRHR